MSGNREIFLKKFDISIDMRLDTDYFVAIWIEKRYGVLMFGADWSRNVSFFGAPVQFFLSECESKMSIFFTGENLFRRYV